VLDWDSENLFKAGPLSPARKLLLMTVSISEMLQWLGFYITGTGKKWQNGLKLMAKGYHGRLVRLSPVHGLLPR